MRFMILVKATPESEAGVVPNERMLAEMAKYNEELVKAGVMLAGDGLQASSKGARVRFEGKKRTVIDGPFVETKELVAGYWIWQCESKQDATSGSSARRSTTARRSKSARSSSSPISATAQRSSSIERFSRR